MTSPDGVIPGGAVNYGSLADFAARTELDWTTEMKGETEAAWGDTGLLGHLWQDLAAGKPLVIAILGSLADALGLGGVWDTVESVVSAIAGFLNRAFEELWQFILDIPIIGDIVEFVGDILAQVVDMLVTLFTNPGQAVAELWNAFKVFIDNLWDGIVDTFVLLFTNPGELLDRLGDAWRGFLNYLGDEFDDVWAAILDVPIVGDIMGWIGEATNDLIDELVLLFTNPGAALEKLSSAFLGFLDNLWDGIVDTFVTLFTNPSELLDRLGDAWRGFVGWIVGELDDVWEWLKDIPVLGAVVELVEDALGTVFGWFTGLAGSLGLDKIWSGIEQVVGDIGGFITGGFDDLWEWLQNVPIVGDVLQWIEEALSDVIGWLVTLFTNPLAAIKELSDAFLGFIDGLWDGIVDEFVLLFTNPGAALQKLADAWRSVTDWIVAELDDIWEWLKDVPILGDVLQFIEDALDEVFGWFRSLAKALGLNKLWDGIESVVSDIGGFVSDIAGSIWHALNGAATWVGKVVGSGLDAVFNAIARLFGKVDTTDKNAAQMMARLATPGVGGAWQAVSSTDEAAFPHTMVNTSDTLGVLGTERSTFIRVRADRTINAIKVALAEAPKMGQFIVKLYRIDPTPITIEGVSGLIGQVLLDLGDQRGALAAAGDVKTILLPKRISISAGDLIAVAMEQRGGTATKFHCATKNAFPESLHRLSTVLTDGRAFVQTTTVMPVAPWVALADVDETKPMPRAFADNFNRAGVNTLGPAWLPRRGQLGVREWDFGWFTPKRTSAVPQSGSSVSTQIARMATADHEVFGVPYSTKSGESSQSYLLARFDGLGNGFAAMLGWWSGRYNVEIRQCTADYDPRNGVVRASAQVTNFMDFTMFKLMCKGTRYSLWYVDRNGSPQEACFWDDLGKLHPYSDANTEVGIGAYQTGMHSAIDDWAAKDLTPTTT